MIQDQRCIHYYERNGRAGCAAGRSLIFNGCPDSCSGYESAIDTDAKKNERAAHYESENIGVVIQNNINSYARTLNEINQTIEETGSAIYRDKVIKEFLHYTKFTGFLLARVINELRGVSLEEFKNKVGGSDFLDLKNSEHGTDQTKTIHLDVIFEYGFLDTLRLRINTEPQSSQKSHTEENENSYSLVARAIYYASVAMATELQTSEQYHKIRKVYSVWICYDRPIPDLREPMIRYNMRPEKNYTYCTKDADGKDSIFTNRHKFDDGDLISVILISVKDIDNAVKSGKTDFADHYDLNTLKEIRSLVSDTVTAAERREFFRVADIDNGKEKNSMTNIERIIHEAEEEKKEAIKQVEEEKKEAIKRAEEEKKQVEEEKKQAEEEKKQLMKELERYKIKYGEI